MPVVSVEQFKKNRDEVARTHEALDPQLYYNIQYGIESEILYKDYNDLSPFGNAKKIKENLNKFKDVVKDLAYYQSDDKTLNKSLKKLDELQVFFNSKAKNSDKTILMSVMEFLDMNVIRKFADNIDVINNVCGCKIEYDNDYVEKYKYREDDEDLRDDISESDGSERDDEREKSFEFKNIDDDEEIEIDNKSESENKVISEDNKNDKNEDDKKSELENSYEDDKKSVSEKSYEDDKKPVPENSFEEDDNNNIKIDIGDENKDKVIKEDDLIKPIGDISASRYIKSIQRMNLTRREGKSKEELFDSCLKIMAARMIANSVRGSKTRLVNTNVTDDQVADTVERLSNSYNFGYFRESLMADDEKFNKFVRVAVKGHGGGLDDMFKDYLKNVKAGTLANEPIIERYMPTAKERIEILQSQAKTCNSKYNRAKKEYNRLEAITSREDYDRSKGYGREMNKHEKTMREEKSTKVDIMLEIMEIRDLVKAKRGDADSLEKAIPVKNITIKQNIELMDIRGVAIDDEIFKKVTKGHGGEMVDSMRLFSSKNKNNNNDQLEDLLYGNTIGARMKELENKATDLKESLERKIKYDINTDDKLKESKNLIAEYLLLDGMTRGSKNKVDETKRLQDVPHDVIDKLMEKGPEKDSRFKKQVGKLGASDTAEMLGLLGEGNSVNFVKGLNDKNKSIEDSKKASSKKTNKPKKAEGPKI
ncbi:MAG: hypothetical protein K6F77_09965 [Lachnospiraceae bacterium]|nr:hypothetical protein [Lachnospiraceae bacterium]